MTAFIEKLEKPRGTVLIRVFHKVTGEMVYQFMDRNLIVKTGRNNLIKFLAGDTVAAITKMKIGSGGTDPGTPLVPIPPTANDTDLVIPKATSTISTVTKDLDATNPTVSFAALFDSANVNDVGNEAGLFFDDGTTMFARHTFRSVPLDSASALLLRIDWTIEF